MNDKKSDNERVMGSFRLLAGGLLLVGGLICLLVGCITVLEDHSYSYGPPFTEHEVAVLIMIGLGLCCTIWGGIAGFRALKNMPVTPPNAFSGPAAPPSAAVRFCPACGTRNAAGARFCSKCGAKMQ